MSIKEEDLGQLSGRTMGQAEQLGMLGHPGGGSHSVWGFNHGQDPESSKRQRQDSQDLGFVLRSASSPSGPFPQSAARSAACYLGGRGA